MAIKCLQNLTLCFIINIKIAVKYNGSVYFNTINFMFLLLAVMKKSGLGLPSYHKQLENWMK